MTPTEARNQRHIKNGHHRIVFGLGVLFIGTLLHTIGTITRNWISQHDINYGIFSLDINVNGAIISVRAFTIIAIILGTGAMILSGIYFRLSTFLNRKKVTTCILVTGIGAGGSSLIGALIFALEYYFLMKITDKNYSFALCIVGGVLILVGSVVIFLGARQHMRGSHCLTGRAGNRSRTDDPSAHPVTYLSPDQTDSQVWHTPLYHEPPPAYNQLELYPLPAPKQQTSQMVFDTLPPSYTDAIKWYPDT